MEVNMWQVFLSPVKSIHVCAHIIQPCDLLCLMLAYRLLFGIRAVTTDRIITDLVRHIKLFKIFFLQTSAAIIWR